MRRFVSTTSRKIFDPALKQIHFARSGRAAADSDYNYLFEESAKQLSDRLLDIKRPFQAGINVIPRNGCMQTQIDEVKDVVEMDDFVDVDDIDTLSEANKYDLALANLSMHWENDLDNVFKKVEHSLKPDAPFLGSFFLTDTLFELKTCLMLAEQERDGGISPHVSPFLNATDLCALVTGSNFKLATIDVVKIEVEYDNMFKLCDHLSWMGESNGVLSRKQHVSKDVFLGAASLYDQLFKNTSTFEIGFFIGWKYDPGQQKPVERGSQDKSFKDITTFNES